MYPRLQTRFILMLSVLVAVTAAGAARAGYSSFDPQEPASRSAAEDKEARQAPPVIHAHEINGHSIELDGRLDDAVWQAAEPAGGFRCWEPDRGRAVSEQTVFKVLYDEEAVYLGVACLESDPGNISSTLSRRDSYSNTDIVSVYIDPYHDRNTGYNFRVNPAGVQMDSYMYNDGDRDDDWDAVWEAETSRDEDGWYAEMRIPFSSIRYRPAESMTWGLQVYRYMHGRGEDTAWHVWDRETRGFISRFGELRGIRKTNPPRQLEVVPYFVQRTTDPSVAGPDDQLEGFQNLGADIKYGITADLTLNATLQPDFGQVEADPAVLNLSPYETFYNEKRPFFIEGSRFFQHPDFNLFYSRRIGTGSEDARIRFAGKVTGKTAGDISVAALLASTDLSREGRRHNIFQAGDHVTHYFVTRLGKEFGDGKYRFNVMQTAVNRTADPAVYDDASETREAYTTGLDFDLNFHNRDYNVNGSFVGSLIDPESVPGEAGSSSQIYGTGGGLELRRLGGNWRGGVYGSWEADDLRLNDVGFLRAPDEISTGYWINYQYAPEGASSTFNRGNFEFNGWRSWIYAPRAGHHAGTGREVWSYGAGHPQYAGLGLNGWVQFRNYWEAWFGTNYNLEGIHRYETRGGPLMREPETYGGWIGFNTDSRKRLMAYFEGNYWRDVAGNVSYHAGIGGEWNQSTNIHHEVDLGYSYRHDDTQYLETVELDERPGGRGIGGRSYVYGEILQQTVDVTLRTSVLFARNQSLEIYAQPFITVGDYSRARELSRPDSYDLIPYGEEGYQVRDNDFSFTAVNLNAVYRWEYRPGSALFLVWTHSRSRFEERSETTNGKTFHNRLDTGDLFDNEPENVFLAKLTYWFAL
ncbi:MAG: hypothetical protein GF355_03980 [Candidatus Eisenbacteria bacterium]|nr:hypothetical protein [Candidatus Eisenbacteria bacterium]